MKHWIYADGIFAVRKNGHSDGLCALLHEFYSVSEFAKEEKKKYNDILVYALSQVGGMEQIYKKMEQPLDRIIYVANQYQKNLKRRGIQNTSETV